MGQAGWPGAGFLEGGGGTNITNLLPLREKVSAKLTDEGFKTLSDWP
jgi:hypothetical protein